MASWHRGGSFILLVAQFTSVVVITWDEGQEHMRDSVPRRPVVMVAGSQPLLLEAPPLLPGQGWFDQGFAIMEVQSIHRLSDD